MALPKNNKNGSVRDAIKTYVEEWGERSIGIGRFQESRDIRELALETALEQGSINGIGGQ